jgi:hypothetical protein
MLTKFVEETAKNLVQILCNSINTDTCSPRNDELKVDFEKNIFIFKKPFSSMDEVNKKLLSAKQGEEVRLDYLDFFISDYKEFIDKWEKHKKNIVLRINSNPEIEKEDNTFSWNGMKCPVKPRQKKILLSFEKLLAENDRNKKMGIEAVDISKDSGESLSYVLETFTRFSDRRLFVIKEKPNNNKDVRWFPRSGSEKIAVENRNPLHSNNTGVDAPNNKDERIYQTLLSLHDKQSNDLGFTGILTRSIANILREEENVVNTSLFHLASSGSVPISSVVIKDIIYWQIPGKKNKPLPPTRELIHRTLKKLEKSGPQTTEAIAEACKIDPGIVSKELTRLKRKKLAEQRKENGKLITWLTMPKRGE